MKRIVLFTLLCVFLSSGCSAGRNFTRPSSDELEFGTTTTQKIVERFGQPYTQGSCVSNDAHMKNLAYSYSHGAGKPHFGGVTPARGMTFGFHEDKLVLYAFSSSFEEDHTYFPEDVLDLIKKGETKRTELYEIIGEPCGHCVYPAIKEKGTVADLYQYTQVRMSGLKPIMYMQTLIVTYDENDVISDIVFTVEGTK